MMDNRQKKVKMLAFLILSLALLLSCAYGFAEEEFTPVPFLTETYQGIPAHLRLLENGTDRVQSYAGPGMSFVSSGGYKPYKQDSITVYFSQDGWALADIVYDTAEERYVWFPLSAFDFIGEVPDVGELPSFEGFVIQDTKPSWGPGSQFNLVETMTAAKGTPIKVFYQENGYVYGEYSYSKGAARMWFPADTVIVSGASVTLTDEPGKQTGESVFGKYTKSNVIRTFEETSTSVFARCKFCDSPNVHYLTVEMGRSPLDNEQIAMGYLPDRCHSQTTRYEAYCPDCGAWWVNHEESHFEPHFFGNDNACDLCGYGVPGKNDEDISLHTFTGNCYKCGNDQLISMCAEIRYDTLSYGEGLVLWGMANPDVSHACTRNFSWYCPNCGEVCLFEYDEGYGSHVFGDDHVCDLCGYNLDAPPEDENAVVCIYCGSKNTRYYFIYDETGYPKYSSLSPELEAEGYQRDEVHVTRYINRYRCERCQRLFDMVEINPHRFEGNVCVDCGYQKTE